MGKHSHVDDEIPLTHTRLNSARETRDRFHSLLRAAVDQEQENVEEASSFAKKEITNVEPAKGEDRCGRGSFSRSVEECALKSYNTSTQRLSSLNLLSSSDEDAAVKEKLNGHLHKYDKENSSKNREQLVLDKRLKDERNSSQVSLKKEVEIDSENEVVKGTDFVKTNTRRRRSIQSESFEENPDCFQGKHFASTSCRNSEHQKKPVPLPRRRTQKEHLKPSETHETEVEEHHQQIVPATSSLNVVLPIDNLKNTSIPAEDGDDDDDDCVLPKKVERRKVKNKKNAHCNVEKKEEIERRNIETPDGEVEGKEVSSGRKSFHKLRRESKEVAVETAVKKEGSQSVELSYDKIVGIFIHRSECLQVDPLVRHPLVKVHLLDAATGNYLKKSNSGRSVSFYNENQEVDYILPLMTEVFDYKERRTIVPFWEELLVFNEDFEYILQGSPPVLILFEVLDFVNFTVASSQYRKLGSEGGWHHVAWAFLKPVGANSVLNTEKQVRLQLYKPQRMRKPSCNSCDVYDWWSSGVWERYPATLYVTVKGITPPEHFPPVLRSRNALQEELSQSPPFLETNQNHSEGDARSDYENSAVSTQLLLSAGTSLPVWSRLPSQSCKIPNHHKLALPTASRGCFFVKFSNSGLHLACSISADEKYIITVYSIPDGKEFAQFVGHQGLVYDLHWSAKDTVLLSASADCTACLWDTDARKSGPMQMLPHPSFVYCAQFHPGNSSVLVTGCYDHVVRVWNCLHKSSQFELVQELEGHTGFVSALSISCSGMMYSGDSLGRILEWTGSKVKSKKQCYQWKFSRNMDIRELRDTVVNRLLIHPGGQRLLVHARDSRLRMLDITTASVIQWFSGALNHRVQTSACLSPCGGLVFVGSEDSTVHVWNADTGEQLAIYSGLQFYRGASGVDYHPFEHMVAFASHGNSSYVMVCDYEKLDSGKDIGLQMLAMQNTTLKSTVGVFTESHLKSSTPMHFGHSSLKEKKRKPMPLSDSEMEVLQGSPSLAADRNGFSLSPNSTNSPSAFIEEDDKSSKVRLASIIEKMDQVLSKTPSKSSQQISESSDRSFAPKLSDSSSSKTENLGHFFRGKTKRETVLSVK